MFNDKNEKEYNEKLNSDQNATISLFRFEQKHPAVNMNAKIQYPSTEETEAHSILLEWKDLTRAELKEAGKKLFGDR